jgi:ribosomal protein S18 acetylase RimI-like enzyme
MVISTAAIADANEILRVQKLAYQIEAARYNDYTIPPLIESVEDIASDIKNQTVLKVTVDGKIIGSIRGYIQGDSAYIRRLFVHPEYRRQGIGTRLMQAIEKSLHQAKRYELFTGHKSVGNIRLYQKLGYGPIRTETINDQLALVYMEKLTDD